MATFYSYFYTLHLTQERMYAEMTDEEIAEKVVIGYINECFCDFDMRQKQNRQPTVQNIWETEWGRLL